MANPILTAKDDLYCFELGFYVFFKPVKTLTDMANFLQSPDSDKQVYIHMRNVSELQTVQCALTSAVKCMCKSSFEMVQESNSNWCIFKCNLHKNSLITHNW